MTCPRCKHGGIVEIGLTVSERKVTMRSCSKCDSRWWATDGEQVDLPGVLHLAARR